MTNSTKLLAATSLALFFLAGVMAGVIMDRKLLLPAGRGNASQGFRNDAGPGQMPGGERMESEHAKVVRRNFTDRLAQGLELSEEQVKKIDSILDENEKKFAKLREQMRDGLTDLDYDLFNKISAVLDDKQKKKLLSEWMSPYHPSEGRGGGMQGGPPPQGQGPEGMRPGMQGGQQQPGGRPPMGQGQGFRGGPDGMQQGPGGQGPGMGGRPGEGRPPQGGGMQPGGGPRGDGFRQPPPGQ